MGPIHGTIVNWFGHKHGYQNFNNGDDSTNCVLWWDLFLLGELFQNNHHHSASSPNFAMKKGEFDPLYPILLLLRKCKIIYFKT
jgi:stearoyl-CoA desaturase (delta-9 desaturase)